MQVFYKLFNKEIKMDFKLKDFRQSHGLFQSQLAEIMGANQSFVSRAELRPVGSITYKHYRLLCDKFGKEEVDSFLPNESISIVATNNQNTGDGAQNIGWTGNDAGLIEIVKKQADAIVNTIKKQNEQTDRLLSILEKMSEK